MSLTLEPLHMSSLIKHFMSTKRNFFVCLETHHEKKLLKRKVSELFHPLEVQTKQYDCPKRLLGDLRTYAHQDRCLLLDFEDTEKSFIEQLLKHIDRQVSYYILCLEHELPHHSLQKRFKENSNVEYWRIKLEVESRALSSESSLLSLSELIKPYLKAQKKKLDDKQIMIALRENPQIFQESLFQISKQSLGQVASLQALIKYLDKVLPLLAQPEPSYLTGRFFKWQTKNAGLIY